MSDYTHRRADGVLCELRFVEGVGTCLVPVEARPEPESGARLFAAGSADPNTIARRAAITEDAR